MCMVFDPMGRRTRHVRGAQNRTSVVGAGVQQRIRCLARLAQTTIDTPRLVSPRPESVLDQGRQRYSINGTQQIADAELKLTQRLKDYGAKSRRGGKAERAEFELGRCGIEKSTDVGEGLSMRNEPSRLSQTRGLHS